MLEGNLEDIKSNISRYCAESVEFTCAPNNNLHVCIAINLQVEHPHVRIKKVNGLKPGQSPSDITDLIIDKQTVKFMPDQLAKILKRMTSKIFSI